MSGQIEMSLDEIIKANKGNKKTQHGKRNNSGVNQRNNKKFVSRQNGIRKPYSKNAPNNAWKNKLVQGNAARKTLVKDACQLLSEKYSSTRIVISNLHFRVTDENIKDLFSLVGKLKKAALHYDSTGKSLGTAEVLYLRKEDAINAIKRYNGMPLDGRKMRIQLTTSEISKMNPSNVKKFNHSGFKNQY